MAGVAKSEEAFESLLPDASWTREMRRRVLAWYRTHKRDLPWRRHRDPYAIWVSEIMLQQTQVETVKPYFERFMNAFPTITALASAEVDDVLRLWEGLGYYRRARQLHHAAGVIVEQHGGEFPTDPAAVIDLPGVGRYTAGAVLSIALDQRQPILEGNTIRVYSRLLAFRDDPRRATGQRLLWRFAEEILPQSRVGELNQAMMELGSQVCQPRNPDCAACPLVKLCPTYENQWQDQIPAAAKKLKYEEVRETAVVVYRADQVLLRKCQPNERWAGLWDFPRFATEGQEQPKQLAHRLQKLTGIDAVVDDHLIEMKHAVTRFRITLSCYRAVYRRGSTDPQTSYAWVTPKQLSDFALSVTGRKISRLL